MVRLPFVWLGMSLTGSSFLTRRIDRPVRTGKRGASVVDRLIGRGPEIEKDARRTGGIPDALGHQNPDQLLLGVHVPRRAVAAVPAVPSRGRRQIVAPGHDGDAESP